jgi:hypothetical protein
MLYGKMHKKIISVEERHEYFATEAIYTMHCDKSFLDEIITRVEAREDITSVKNRIAEYAAEFGGKPSSINRMKLIDAEIVNPEDPAVVFFTQVSEGVYYTLGLMTIEGREPELLGSELNLTHVNSKWSN